MAAKRRRRRAGKRRAGKRKSTTVRRKRRALRAGTRRRARRHNPRRSRARGRRYVASRGKGNRRRARTFRVKPRRGRAYHVRGWRARRRNPSASGLVTAAIAVGAGLAATLVASYAIDVFLSTQSSMVQTGVLVALAAGTAYLVASPAIAAGVATGLLVVPLSKAVYSAVPSLANPAPMGGTPALPAAGGAMSALHRAYGKVSGRRGPRIGQLHLGAPIRALHKGAPRMSALHLRGVTLNRGAGSNPILARSFGR